MGLLDILGKAAGVALAPATGGASLAPMLIGGGLGAAKHFMVDKPAEEASRKQSAAMMRVSPWSGIAPSAVKSAPGLFSSALQGGAMGATAGNMLGGAAAQAAPSISALQAGGQLSPMAGNAQDWFKMGPSGGGTGYDFMPGATSGRGMLR